MSRKLVLGLHQVLCRAPAGLLLQSQSPAYVQAIAQCQQAVAAYSELPLGSRPFAASAYQSPAAQASASTEPLSQAPASNQHLDSPQEYQVPTEQYSFSGTTTGPYVVKPKPVFAVVELGPTQFKVTPDDLVYSEKLKNVDVGDRVSLNRVLLLGNAATTVIGRPCVPGATVTAVVEVRPKL